MSKTNNTPEEYIALEEACAIVSSAIGKTTSPEQLLLAYGGRKVQVFWDFSRPDVTALFSPDSQHEKRDSYPVELPHGVYQLVLLTDDFTEYGALATTDHHPSPDLSFADEYQSIDHLPDTPEDIEELGTPIALSSPGSLPIEKMWTLNPIGYRVADGFQHTWPTLEELRVSKSDIVRLSKALAQGRLDAMAILERPFARLDNIAWAMVILSPDGPGDSEERYRKILGVTRWLNSLELQFRHSDGFPASQPKGVPVTDMDVREYQYLAVADVRAVAIEARCWPIEEKHTVPMPPISDFAPRPVRLPNASRVNVECLVREIAFALVEIPDDKRLATLEKETPDGPDRWNIEPLTGDDWRLVREICGSKPPAPCSPAQFEAWRAPFDTAPNRPHWDLRPEFKPSHEMQVAQSRWSLFSVQHLRQIRQKAERKELSLITPAGIETSDIYDNAGLAVGCLRIADAKAYLDQCCIAWEVTSVADPAASATTPKKSMTHNKPNWSVWHCMHKVSLFDAICLSYDVAPGAATLNPIENGLAHLLGLDFVGWDVSRKISDRLSIARSHARTGGTLPTVTEGNDVYVSLATFAEWALNTMKWTVPDELRALASAAQSTSAVAQSPLVAPPFDTVSQTGDGTGEDPVKAAGDGAARNDESQVDGAMQASAGPPAVPSSAISIAFDGLNNWDNKKWARYLGDPPKWLAKARVRQGRPGVGDASTWDPVTVAAALYDKGVALSKLDAAFKRQSMKAWATKWQEKSEYLRL